MSTKLKLLYDPRSSTLQSTFLEPLWDLYKEEIVDLIYEFANK